MRQVADRPLLNDRIAPMNESGRIHAWFTPAVMPVSHCEIEICCAGVIATGLLLLQS